MLTNVNRVRFFNDMEKGKLRQQETQFFGTKCVATKSMTKKMRHIIKMSIMVTTV